MGRSDAGPGARPLQTSASPGERGVQFVEESPDPSSPDAWFEAAASLARRLDALVQRMRDGTASDPMHLANVLEREVQQLHRRCHQATRAPRGARQVRPPPNDLGPPEPRPVPTEPREDRGGWVVPFDIAEDRTDPISRRPALRDLVAGPRTGDVVFSIEDEPSESGEG